MARGIVLLKHSSFKTRLRLIFLLFAGGLSVMYGMSVFFSIQQTEDFLQQQFIDKTFDSVLADYPHTLKKNTLEKSTKPLGVTVYQENDPALPDWISKLDIGVYDMAARSRYIKVTTMAAVNVATTNSQTNVSKANVNDTSVATDMSKRLYLVFNTENFLEINNMESIIMSVLVAIGGLISLLGGLVGLLIARQVSEPLLMLADDVKDISREHQQFYGHERHDEVGQLSKSFSGLVSRLYRLLDREQSFTRHASHELRTPIAILRNSMSLLSRDISAQQRQRAEGRMESAIDEMENLVETFLMLGREAPTALPESFSVDGIIENCCYKYRHPIQEKRMNLTLSLDKQTTQGFPALFTVLVDNLLRNAIQHGHQNISIQLEKGMFTVTNDLFPSQSSRANSHTSVGKNTCQTNEKNYGYGLEIVERIVEYHGWQQRIEHEATQYKVMVRFFEKGANPDISPTLQ